MSVGFTKNDIAGDIAEGLRHEQGSGYQNAIQYQIQDFAGHSLNTSGNWFGCKNLPGVYEWLTLVKLFGTGFANRSLARLGFKLVPLDAGEVDTAQLAEIATAADVLSAKIQEAKDGASKPKLVEVGKGGAAG